MAIYTRCGDAGLTDLASGRRVHKDDVRVEVYGTLDELGAVLGLARALCHAPERIGKRTPPLDEAGSVPDRQDSGAAQGGTAVPPSKSHGTEASRGVRPLACQLTRAPPLALNKRLLDIQHQLSALCGWFANPGACFPSASIGETALHALEVEIDQASNATGPLRDFAMPGTSMLEAALHQARTVCRRAERRAVCLARQEETTDPLALAYLNRLSDWLFAQARVAARAAEDSAEARNGSSLR